jgi:hypothetical protein
VCGVPDIREIAMRSIMLSLSIVAVSTACMLGAAVYATSEDTTKATPARPELRPPAPKKETRPQLWAANNATLVR